VKVSIEGLHLQIGSFVVSLSGGSGNLCASDEDIYQFGVVKAMHSSPAEICRIFIDHLAPVVDLAAIEFSLHIRNSFVVLAYIFVFSFGLAFGADLRGSGYRQHIQIIYHISKVVRSELSQAELVRVVKRYA
jgi:hypothetical protein